MWISCPHTACRNTPCLPCPAACLSVGNRPPRRINGCVSMQEVSRVRTHSVLCAVCAAAEGQSRSGVDHLHPDRLLFPEFGSISIGIHIGDLISSYSRSGSGPDYSRISCLVIGWPLDGTLSWSSQIMQISGFKLTPCRRRRLQWPRALRLLLLKLCLNCKCGIWELQIPCIWAWYLVTEYQNSLLPVPNL